MTPDEFKFQMGRLSEQFGKASYGTERAMLIWREVKDFDVKWFTRLVERFIGEERYAPLVDKFAEAASYERDRLYKIEKEKNSREAERAMRSIYSDDDIKMFCKTIRERVEGKMGDQDFSAIRTLMESAPVANYACKKCDDSGTRFVDSYVYRCPCPTGRKDQRSYPIYQGGQ